MILFSVMLGLLLVTHLSTPFWWWIVAVPLAVSGLFRLPARTGFICGFCAGALAWGGPALILGLGPARFIAGRMAVLFHAGSGGVVILTTALAAGLIAGLSALSGAWLGSVWGGFGR